MDAIIVSWSCVRDRSKSTIARIVTFSFIAQGLVEAMPRMRRARNGEGTPPPEPVWDAMFENEIRRIVGEADKCFEKQQFRDAMILVRTRRLSWGLGIRV
jgi:hypothetical protein